ncbi:MAG: VOC family protein [Chloroflexota bacterium]
MVDTFPSDEVTVGQLLVVRDMARSKAFYCNVLGATLAMEYLDAYAQVRLANGVIHLVLGGGPTADKPNVTFAAPEHPNLVSAEVHFFVQDCIGTYELLKSRGLEFLTPPVVRPSGEVRCFAFDPDGHLLEFSAFNPPEG